MEKEKTTYYCCGIPDSVRIVGDTIGLDATIVPPLTLIGYKDTRKTTGYFADLLELAKSPQIDHIYIASDYIFRADENGEYIDNEGVVAIDLCDPNIDIKETCAWDKVYPKIDERRRHR